MTVISLDEHRAHSRRHGHEGESLVVHLPVAPHVTAMTRFSSVLPSKLSFMMPEESLEYLHRIYRQGNGNVSMVAISGPGDPLAVPDTTIRTIDLVKNHYPDVKIGLKTLGIGAEKFASDLSASGVSYVEMVVNGVKEDILEKLYAWIRPGLKTLKIRDAVKLLISEQKNGIPALRYNDIGVTVETTLYPGINHKHIGMISKKTMELGAECIAVMPYVSVPGCEVENREPSEQEMNKCRTSAAQYLPVVEPLLNEVKRCGSAQALPSDDMRMPLPTVDKPNVAVVSSNGVEIDTHLGQAQKILIYGPREDGLPCLLEVRDAPAPGSGSARWNKLAMILRDCFVLLATQAGDTPRSVLAENNISVLLRDDQIEGIVDALYGGGKKKSKGKKN